MFGARWHIYKRRWFAEGLCYHLSSLCKDMNVSCEGGHRNLPLLVPVGLGNSLHWSLPLGLHSLLIIWGMLLHTGGLSWCLVGGGRENFNPSPLDVLGEKH